MQRFTRSSVIAMSLGAGLALSSGQAKASFQQANLVSDLPGAQFQDPDLVNPWGMAESPKGTIWVSDNGTNLSTLYSAAGVKNQNLIVSIPSGAPDGQVFNPNPSNFLGAHFIFASENGGVDAWSTGSSAVNRVGTSTSSVYKGLTIGSNNSGTFLYVANFRAGTIDVFTSAFAPASLAGSFTDPHLPAGYAPFNVQNINGKLYVTYAVQDAAKHDDVAGAGNGIVDVFDTSGNFLQRLVSNGGVLNSPWGLAMAPSNFGEFSNDLLVGNFGDGTVNAFDPKTGALIGTLTDASGHDIVIQGLWGLMFGNGVGGATNELFFTAGIPGPDNVEDHGLFGTLTLVPEPSTLVLLVPGLALLALRRRQV
jgi:uncharacterized protein (TIGR03118 family)